MQLFLGPRYLSADINLNVISTPFAVDVKINLITWQVFWFRAILRSWWNEFLKKMLIHLESTADVCIFVNFIKYFTFTLNWHRVLNTCTSMFYLIYEDILRAWYRIKDYEPQLKAFFFVYFISHLIPKYC